MATEAARLNGNTLEEKRKPKCPLTSTGLLMEGVGKQIGQGGCILIAEAPHVSNFRRLEE